MQRADSQPIDILEHVRGTVKVLARELGVSEATIYTWKSKYGGMEVNEARRRKELEDENRRLEHMVVARSANRSPDSESNFRTRTGQIIVLSSRTFRDNRGTCHA